MIEIRREQNIREKDKKSKEKRPENNHVTESTVGVFQDFKKIIVQKSTFQSRSVFVINSQW